MCGFCGKEAQLPVSDGKARSAAPERGVFARGPEAASQFASLTRPVAFGAGASPHGSRTPARGGYAEGIGPRSWQMKRSKLSKRASTRWDELMVVG